MDIIFMVIGYLILTVLTSRFLVWVSAKYCSWPQRVWEDDDTVLVVILSIFWFWSMPIILLIMLGVAIRKKCTGTIFPFAKWFDEDKNDS